MVLLRALEQKSQKFFCLIEQVGQQYDPFSAKGLLIRSRETFPASTRLPLMSKLDVNEAHKLLWKCFSTRKTEDVKLNHLIVTTTNQLSETHNYNALEYFPGRMYELKSATTIVLNWGTKGEKCSAYIIIGPELTYNYASTGVPHQHLKLKLDFSVFVIENVLHLHLLKGKMFIVTSIYRTVIRLSGIDENGEIQQSLLVPRWIPLWVCNCGNKTSNVSYQIGICSNGA